MFFWNRVDSPPTNSISLTLLHITSRTWSRPRRRRGWRPLGTVAVLSSRHDDLNDCLDVALDVLLPWRSGCSLTKQLLTFCLLHPCSIALSTHQLHHQVFPTSNLNALPVPNAKQVEYWKPTVSDDHWNIERNFNAAISLAGSEVKFFANHSWFDSVD